MAEPAWIKIATEELARLKDDGGAQATIQKKRDTIIALVEARLAQKTEESVWRLPHTCARQTYHTKWKKDELFSDVLDKVTSLAREWQDTANIRAVTDAAEIIQMAAPLAAKTLVEIMTGSQDERLRKSAADSLLDRSAVETAVKTAQAQHHTSADGQTLEEWQRHAKMRASQVEATLEDFEDEWDEDWQDEGSED